MTDRVIVARDEAANFPVVCVRISYVVAMTMWARAGLLPGASTG